MNRKNFLALFTAVLFSAVSSQAFASQGQENFDFLGDSTLNAKVNPFESKLINNTLQIKFLAGNGSGVVGMHDILGNRIFESTASEFVDFNMNNLKPGVYFIVWREGKQSYTRRFVYRPEN